MEMPVNFKFGLAAMCYIQISVTVTFVIILKNTWMDDLICLFYLIYKYAEIELKHLIVLKI